MLVVKVELWPWGDEGKKKELGQLVIGNQGRLPDGTCAYSVSGRCEPWPEKGRKEEVAYGCVLGYNREQNVWLLVQKALEEIKWEK